MSGGEARAYKQLFPTKHIPIVLFSILQVGSTIRKKTENDREDWITRRLHRELIRIPEFRDGPLDIRPQPEIPSVNPDIDTPAGKIDLLVSCGLGHEVYFAIEAKRLRFCSPGGKKVSSGSHQYVMEGMMRFVRGQYAPHMEAGAMLGYVFDGNVREARSSVGRSVQNKAMALKLAHSKAGLMPSPILSGAAVDETRHDLTPRPFTIYHVFIAV